MQNLEFQVRVVHSCLYVLKKEAKILHIAFYADDGLVSATDEESSEFISKSKSKFKITCKPASYSSGLENKLKNK